MKKWIFIAVLAFVNVNVTAQSKALASVIDDDKMYGFINKKGEMVIPAKFEKTGNFSDGLAAAYDGDNWGYINPKGEWAIPPKFEHVKSFDTGVAIVEIEGKWEYINKSGEVLNIAKSEKLYDFHDGVAFFRKGDLVGLMNTKGEIIVEPKFKKITAFHNGYARFVSQSDQWGIVDTKGNIVVEAKYDAIGSYVDQVAWVRNGEQLGLVSGDTYTKIDAVKIWDFASGENLTYAQKDELIGFMNKKGKWVIPPTFEKAKSFSKDLAPAYDGENWGFVDRSGKYVIAPQYENVDPFSADGLAAVKIDGEYGFIDTQGKLVIEAKYEISSGGGGKFGAFKAMVSNVLNMEQSKGFVNGLARVEHKGDFGFIDTAGNLLGNTWYRGANLFVNVE